MKEINFEYVHLKNFRCHEDLRVEFEPNRFSLITGDNGTGKTTIFDAVCWALYDLTTKKKRKADSVIRIRSGRDTEVELAFRIDDKQYVINNYRNHKKFKNKKFLNGDEGLGRSELNDKISNLVMPYHIFLNSLLFSQYIEKAFAEMGNTDQVSIFDEITGSDKYDVHHVSYKKASDNQTKLIEGLNKEILVFDNTVSMLNEQLDDKHGSLDNQKNLFVQKESTLNNEIQILELGVKTLEVTLNDFKDFNERQLEFNSSLATAKSKLEQNNQNCENEIEKVNMEMETKKDKYKNDIISKNQTEITKFKEEIASLSNEIENLENSKEGTRNKIDLKYKDVYLKLDEHFKSRTTPIDNNLNQTTYNLSSEEENKIEIINTIQNLKTEIETKTNLTEGENPTCYACGQGIKDESLTKVLGEVEKLKSSLLEEEQKLLDCENKISKLKEELAKLEEEKTKFVDLYNNELTKIEIQKSKELESIKEIDEKINKKQSEIEKKQTLLSLLQENQQSQLENLDSSFKIELANKIEKVNNKYSKTKLELESQITEIEKHIESLQEEIDNFNKVTEDLNKTKTLLTTKKELLNTLISTNNENEKSLLLEISKIEEKIEKTNVDKSKQSGKIELVEEEKNIIDFWKKGFGPSGIKSILLDEAIPILNEKARDLCKLTDLVKVSFDSQKTIGSGESRNKFTVLATQTKNLTGDIEDFSAGESKLVNIITFLSLRHFLEKINNVKFNILLMDEVLDTLSPNNVNSVINMLTKIAEDYCLFLITHTFRENIECDEMLPL